MVNIRVKSVRLEVSQTFGIVSNCFLNNLDAVIRMSNALATIEKKCRPLTELVKGFGFLWAIILVGGISYEQRK
jgi:hypothetical protein